MNKQTEALPDVLVSLPPLWRLQLVHALQLVGILGGFLGGADFLQLLAVLPPEWAAWLLIAGPAFAAGSKPAVMLIGDFVDDGLKNNSFKIPIMFFFVGCLALGSMGLNSCANLPGLGFGITPDGCALATYKDPKTGQTFKSGVCAGPDGTVSHYVTEWMTTEGNTARAIRPTSGGPTVLVIKDPAGGWVRWDAKAGLSLGPIPTASLE